MKQIPRIYSKVIYLASQGNFVNAYLGEQEGDGQVLKHRNELTEKDLTFLYFDFIYLLQFLCKSSYRNWRLSLHLCCCLSFYSLLHSVPLLLEGVLWHFASFLCVYAVTFIILMTCLCSQCPSVKFASICDYHFAIMWCPSVSPHCLTLPWTFQSHVCLPSLFFYLVKIFQIDKTDDSFARIERTTPTASVPK